MEGLRHEEKILLPLSVARQKHKTKNVVIADGFLPAMESIKATENHNVGERLFNAKAHGEVC